MRASEAADFGFLGFGNTYHATFEGSVVVMPAKWLVLAYEFRQRTDPYTLGLAPLIGPEDNAHAIDLSLIVNRHTLLSAGYGFFGNLANAEVNSAWWLQMKYDF